MKYYLHIAPYDFSAFNAGSKARNDIDSILEDCGYKKITAEYSDTIRQGSIFNKIAAHKKVEKLFEDKTRHLKKGDVLFIQLPIRVHTLFFSHFLKKLAHRGVKTIAIVHDLDYIRFRRKNDRSVKEKLRMTIEEKQAIKALDAIIVHNKIMRQMLISDGLDPKSIITLGIFDYYMKESDRGKWHDFTGDQSVIVAGNLMRDKAGYIYELPKEPSFKLYGADYEEGYNKENVSYEGKRKPDEIPFALDGAYGLVWDGPSSHTCEGDWGEYLKINNPHKVSLYLAAGLPVIIWNQAAMADFIIKNNCGLTVSSLHEIKDKLKGIDDNEYQEMKRNARAIGEQLRAGESFRNALNKAMEI